MAQILQNGELGVLCLCFPGIKHSGLNRLFLHYKKMTNSVYALSKIKYRYCSPGPYDIQLKLVQFKKKLNPLFNVIFL